MDSFCQRISTELSVLRRSFITIRELPNGISLREPSTLLATWFGSGLIRPMSGTWGTVASVPFGYTIMLFGGWKALLAAALIFLWVGTKVSSAYCSRSGEHDASAITIDETVGMWLAALPAGLDPLGWFVAFIFFRIFDIKKPWPCSYFEQQREGGINVMMDDVFAGIYAFLCTAIFIHVIG